MRKPTRSALGNMLKSMAVCHSTVVPDESGYVIDGSYLLHNNHV